MEISDTEAKFRNPRSFGVKSTSIEGLLYKATLRDTLFKTIRFILPQAVSS